MVSASNSQQNFDWWMQLNSIVRTRATEFRHPRIAKTLFRVFVGQMYKCGTKHCDEAHLSWIDCVNCLWECSKWLQTLIKDSTLAVSGTLWSMRGQFLPSAEWKRILVCPVYGGLTTWRAERGSVCRAARGAGRKTSSEENPPWTCQRSIKTTDEWCRHTQAKMQVRHRIYVSASGGTPTDRSRAVWCMLDTTEPSRNGKLRFDWLTWRTLCRNYVSRTLSFSKKTWRPQEPAWTQS